MIINIVRLGASHSPGNANKCPVDDGYLMSRTLVVSSDSFVWSNCSAHSIYKFLVSEPRARCLFNEPSPEKTGVKVSAIKLPGKFYSRDEQCRILMGTESCDSESCDKLYCKREQGMGRFFHRKACVNAPNVAVPEGAPCAQGHVRESFFIKVILRN